MRVAVVYCFPQVKAATYYPLARRFGDTWRRFPPGSEPHTLYVIGNVAPVPAGSRGLFPPGAQFLVHDNSGWDIGAFQLAAERIPCDLLVCFGAPVHFHRTGWLDRMVAAYLNQGPALFGCWGVPFRDFWHIRTTAFWFPPQLLQAYPRVVGSTRPARYDFEHGPNNFTLFAQKNGLEPLMITLSGCYRQAQWKEADGGREESLVFDQFTHR